MKYYKILLIFVLVLVLSSFAFAGDKTNYFGTIDFVIDSNDINYNDYYIGNDIISVNSDGYTFEKDFQFIDEPVCLQYDRERINGTWVNVQCSNWDTQQVLDKVVLAKLEMKTCEEGEWYRIYKHPLYTTDKERIIKEGSRHTDVQCINNKVSFEIDSFSSYSSEQIAALQANNILYYSFDDADLTGSNPDDISGSGYDGTNNGATTGSTGIAGEAFSFDGTNDYIHKTDETNLQLVNTDYTIAFWYNADSGIVWGTNRRLLAKDDGADTNGGYGIAHWTQSNILHTHNPDGNNNPSIGNRNVSQWYHLVITYNSTSNTAYMYVDTTLKNTDVKTADIATETDNLCIATYCSGSTPQGQYWKGLIDEVGIWERQLSETEIEQLWNISQDGYNIYNYPITTNNVSYLAIPINVSDFSFSSSTDVLFANYTFNVSQNETNLGLLSAFDSIKSTGSGSSDITITVDLDGTEYFSDVVRTLTRDQYGVSGIDPLLFSNISSGSHSLEFYIQRSGNGQIDVSNMDLSLGQFVTTADQQGRGNLTTIEGTINTASLASVWNKTIDKGQNTSTYLAGTFRFTSASDTQVLCQFRDGGVSPYMVVDVSAGQTRTVAMNYITEPASPTEQLDLFCSATTGTTATVNGTLIEVDKKDQGGNDINFVTATNSSTNFTNTVTINAGHTDYLNKEITLQNGSEFFISGSISFNSSSGPHAPTFHINVTNSTGDTVCLFEKQRYSNGDIGNVFFYSLCTDLVVGQTYTIKLGVDVDTGESLVIYDESWSTFETTPFDVSIANVQPFVAIEYPTDNLRVRQTVEVNWTASDFQGDRFIQNVTLSNSSNTYILQENLSDSIFNITFDSTAYADGLYNITVSVCENETVTPLCNSDIVPINITQVVYPIITINAPIADSTIILSPTNLKVTANEPITAWNYSLNGGANVSFTPNTTIELSVSGVNNLTVYGNGTEGIGSATVSFTYTPVAGGGGITQEQLDQIVNATIEANAIDDVWLMIICILLAIITIKFVLKD